MPASATRLVASQSDFSGGVDSGKPPLIQSAQNPHGLRPDQTAWITNGTCRGGGILTRTGWKAIAGDFPGDDGWFQGAGMYEPVGTGGFPYIIFNVAGRTFICHTDTDNSIQEITIPGDPNPPGLLKNYFAQGEMFELINAGDFTTQNLVWNGVVLQRITAFNNKPTNLPPGGPVDYFMGRFIEVNGPRSYMAGDLVGSTAGTSTGTAPYGFRDSILYSTENSFLSGGGSFIVPSNAGSIRAIKHSSNLDTALGEGTAFIFTPSAIYANDFPPDRTTWAAPLSTPLQRVAQLKYGSPSDRSVVAVNGDLFYQAFDGVRSLFTAVRWFHQWGQTPISRNENRLLQFNNRGFLQYASGVEFDNRLLQTAIPVQTPVGIGHQLLIPLDFDLITSFQEKLPPAWEGSYEGLDHLQLLEADFGGLQRCFSIVHSRVTDRIQVWELTNFERFENPVIPGGPEPPQDNRNTMAIEFPSQDFGDITQFKQLDNALLWLDKIYGTIDLTWYYRPDSDPCWHFWHTQQECASRTSCEDRDNPVCYPITPWREQFRQPIVLPKAPPDNCDVINHRPSDFGYSFQMKLVVKGWCRVRRVDMFAFPREKPTYEGLKCPGGGVRAV